MSQKLSELIIQRFPWMQFPRVKTKAEIRREASKKAARTVKRQKRVRAAEAAKQAQDVEKAA